MPEDETRRLQALRDYEILDTGSEVAFDELTELAASICEAPIALISLVDADRQWFKSRIGLGAQETSRDVSFCAHAILEREVLHVPDALNDYRFFQNPLVSSDPHIRFYAGAPLITPQGVAVGTLCAIDQVPRQLNTQQLRALTVLAKQVVDQLELRIALKKLSRANATKNRLFSVIAHDLRSSFAGILGLADCMNVDSATLSPAEFGELARNIRGAADSAAKLLDNLLSWSRLEIGHMSYTPAPMSAVELIQEVLPLVSHVAHGKQVRLTTEVPDSLILTADRNMLRSVLQNLISNAIKFTPAGGEVRIEAARMDDGVRLAVRDTGVGMTPEQRLHLFDIDRSSSTRGTAGEPGTGLGLLLCRQFVERHGAELSVESEVGQGSTFGFTLPDRPARERSVA